MRSRIYSAVSRKLAVCSAAVMFCRSAARRSNSCLKASCSGVGIVGLLLWLAVGLGSERRLEVSLLYNAMLHLDRDEPELALRRLEMAEALAAEQRLGFAVDPQILHGAVLTAQGALARWRCRGVARRLARGEPGRGRGCDRSERLGQCPSAAPAPTFSVCPFASSPTWIVKGGAAVW